MSEIKLTADSGGGTTSLKAPSSTTSNADVVLKLPVADGSANQVLKTDGSGQLSFTSNAGTTINNNADNRVITGSGTASTLNGESGLIFDSNGRLGIGTSSPDSRLHLSFDSGDSQIRLTRSNAASNTNDYGRILWESQDDVITGRIAVARESAENNGYMHFATASGGTLSERMRIDSSGRVMIGTTSTSGISSNGDDLIIGSIGDSTDRGITLATTTSGSIRWADAGDNAMGRIQYLNNSDVMTFHTSNATRLRLDSDGMKFGSDSAAANALNDYEEGTFTPALSNGTGITISQAVYTKIGRVCTIHVYVTISSNSSSSGLIFTGLPFVEGNDGYAIGSAYTQFTGATHIFTQVAKNNSYIEVLKMAGNSISQSDVSGGYVLFSNTYFTTD